MTHYSTAAETAALIQTATPEQTWLQAQLERIDPHCLEQGHDGAYTRALEALVIEIKAQPVQPAPKGYFEEQPDGTVIPVDPSEMQPAPLADAEERADFEAWIAKDGGDIRTFGIGANTHYQNSAVNNSWQGWKRRAITKVRTGGAG